MQGSKLATLPRPDSVLEVLLINCEWLLYITQVLWLISMTLLLLVIIIGFEFAVPRGVVYGCGDLIFSSHMIFTLVFVRTYQKYGTLR